jgi:hypothetical protein
MTTRGESGKVGPRMRIDVKTGSGVEQDTRNDKKSKGNKRAVASGGLVDFNERPSAILNL